MKAGVWCSARIAAQRSGQARAILPAPKATPVAPLLKRKSWNKHADHTEKGALDKYKLNRAHIEAHKEAMLDIVAAQAATEAALSGGKTTKYPSVASIVDAKNQTLPSDVRPLSKSALARAVAEGTARLSPTKAGRPSSVPTSRRNFFGGQCGHSWLRPPGVTSA